MNAARSTGLGRWRKFARSITLTLTTLILMLIPAITSAQTVVFVPGNASGCFGNPSDGCVPFVPAITVSGPGTITVTYVSGLVIWGGGETGPMGTSTCTGCDGMQYPLDEANGYGIRNSEHLAALIGVFVPKSRVENPRGFQALDGTKNLTPVGINPDSLHFIGKGRTFTVKEAGTLFLGINDTYVYDNGGGFTVTATGQ